MEESNRFQAGSIEGMFVASEQGVIESFNQGAQSIFGYSADEAVGVRVEAILPGWHLVRGNTLGPPNRKGSFASIEGHHKSGETLLLEGLFEEIAVDGKQTLVGVVRDLNVKRCVEGLRELQAVVLEMVATGRELGATLDKICVLVEQVRNSGLCSILLVDEEGTRLRPGAGPSLPRAELEALDGLVIGDRAGSCGTAAFTCKPAFVENTAADPRWAAPAFQWFAQTFGVKACWSMPFLSKTGSVLGTFAISHTAVCRPTPRDEEAIRTAAHLAGIAVEHVRIEEELRRARDELEQLVEQRTSQLERAQRQLLEASRQAGMAEVATDVLHNVGNTLASVAVSADVLQQTAKSMRIKGLIDVIQLLDRHAGRLADFVAKDPRGQKLPNYLSTFASFLKDKQRAVLSEARKLLESIEHIRSIIAVQQLNAKTLALEECVSLREVLDDAVRINLASLRRHGIEVVYQCTAVPRMTVIRSKLMQILTNLIGNAKYAILESGCADPVITLRLLREGDNVVFVVHDNGAGIAEENLARVFQHGFTTRVDGHGFGLHASALAARDLGGSLKAQSDGPGQGATFTLQLPFRAATDSENSSGGENYLPALH